MRGYKQIAAKFADGFQSGASIQIAPYSYYREGEGDRADRLEGMVEYHAKNVQLGHQRDPEYAAARVAMGLPADGFVADNVIIQNYTVRRHLPTAMLFCCSAEPDLSRVERHGEAIFEISDLHLFAHRIFKAAFRVLDPAKVGPVVYQPRSVDPFDAGPIDSGPFYKSIALQVEREPRIVWACNADVKEPLRVAATRCADLISLVRGP